MDEGKEQPKKKVVRKVVRKVVTKKTTSAPLKDGDETSHAAPSKAQVSRRPSPAKSIPPEQKQKIESVARAKVDFEKQAYEYQRHMIRVDNNLTPLEFVDMGARMMPDQYEDVIQERSLAGLCGYPLCTHKLPHSVLEPTQRYQISIKDKKVYDLQQLRYFHAEQCYINSRLYATQIPDTLLHIRDFEQEKTKMRALVPLLSPTSSSPTPPSSLPSPHTPSQRAIHDLPAEFQEMKITERDTSNIPPTAPTLKSSSSSSIEGFEPKTLKKTQAPSSSSSSPSPSIPPPSRPTPVPKKSKIKPTLSSFGTIWTSLERWCTPRTAKYIFDPADEKATSTDTKEANEEAPIVGEMTLHTEDDDDLTVHSSHFMRKDVLYQGLATYMPDICRELGLSRRYDQEVVSLIATFNLSDPLLSFTASVWRTLAILFLHLLSFRIPTIPGDYTDERAVKLRSSYNIREDEFKVFFEFFTDKRMK
eukprot:TRINITY_DN8039_c0_g1_i2.p1 TRINITY_DN8039_c0_g1~~TRINITY_DN8039_c0_g1_i2.p1  ORF type:complete len:475 (+),score=90.60 TRINITY_DN8039_c0_g1_i2:148-1572(+)